MVAMSHLRLEPRKAPGQDRAKATVTAILEAAAHVLDEHGLEGFNTNAVAARAGVSIGSLYQYFPGKDALTAALIRREHEALLVDIDAGIASSRGASLDALIDVFAGVAVDHQLGRPRLARLLDVEEQRLPPLRETEAISLAIRHRIEAFLAEHDLGGAERETVAGDLLAIARGIVDAAAQLSTPDPTALRRRVRHALAGYLDQTAKCEPVARP